MAARTGMHDEIMPVLMRLTAARADAQEALADPPTGVDMVAVPVTIELPLTPELRRLLAGT